MRVRVFCVSAVAAAVAFMCAPAAFGGRLVSVGYRTPAALHGLRVVQRVPALRAAEVDVSSHRRVVALRARAGIRYVQPIVTRRYTGEPIFADIQGAAVLQWQWAAMRAEPRPGRRAPGRRRPDDRRRRHRRRCLRADASREVPIT